MSLQTYALGALLGLCLLLGVGYDRERGKRATAEAEKKAAILSRDEHKTAAADWETQAATANTALADCRRQWHDIQAENRDLRRQQSEFDARQAEQQRAWRARWDSRTASCGAALLDMQTACAELGALE